MKALPPIKKTDTVPVLEEMHHVVTTLLRRLALPPEMAVGTGHPSSREQALAFREDFRVHYFGPCVGVPSRR